MRKKSAKMTKDLVLKIKDYLRRNLYQHQIAAIFGVNQGRISEVKNGYYDWML